MVHQANHLWVSLNWRPRCGLPAAYREAELHKHREDRYVVSGVPITVKGRRQLTEIFLNYLDPRKGIRYRLWSEDETLYGIVVTSGPIGHDAG